MGTGRKDPSIDFGPLLGEALAGIEAPATGDVDIDAGFFHRTLARWLGLPEGKQPARKKDAAPLWDYDFWKAELVDDGYVNDRHCYSARVFRAAAGAPELYRYWVKIDGAGRIRASGWLTAAPDLVTSASSFNAPASLGAVVLNERDAGRLFADEEA